MFCYLLLLSISWSPGFKLFSHLLILPLSSNSLRLQEMLRRINRSAATAALPIVSAMRNYNVFIFKNPERVPQLTPEQREKVVINYDEWPAEFKDWDPEDPYKNSPPFIEGLSTLQYYLWGAEAAFIFYFYECVFVPKGL